MPVAALQVQIKLSLSLNHRGTIVFAQPAMRAGSRRAWKSPVNNGAYRALFTVSFAHVVQQHSSLPVSWQLSRQVPSPRRQSSVPTTDAAQSISLLLSDPLYRLWVGFFRCSLARKVSVAVAVVRNDIGVAMATICISKV